MRGMVAVGSEEGCEENIRIPPYNKLQADATVHVMTQKLLPDF